MWHSAGVAGLAVALTLVPAGASAQGIGPPVEEAKPWVMGLSGAATGALAATALGLPPALTSTGEISAAAFGLMGAGVGIVFGTPLGVTLAGRRYGAPVSYGRALLGTFVGMLPGVALGAALASRSDYSTPSLLLGLGATLLGGTVGAVWMSPRTVTRTPARAHVSFRLSPAVVPLPQGSWVGIAGSF